MSRLIWALFCEDHTTGDAGKNSYLNVFDLMRVAIRSPAGPASAGQPGQSAHTSPFVLALNLTAEPGAPACTVHIRDPEGSEILAPMSSRLPDSPEGRHNLHLRFPQGIPVSRSGIYVFEVLLDDEPVGQAELPVSVDSIA
jgi:hypothetical protein